MAAPGELEQYLGLLPGFDPYASTGGYVFNEEEAQRAIDFIEQCCCHVKGSLRGKPLLLQPWQKGLVANAFGWIDSLGVRRFTEVFVYIPRKNGKSILIAAIGLYLMLCDNEPGAEIYCAAAEQQQAALVWDMAKEMVLLNDELKEMVKPYYSSKSLVDNQTASFIKPISAEADTKHGFNAHAALVDELHVHKSSELWDTLETSMGAREKPIMIGMTTADRHRPSMCNRKLAYAKKILSGEVDDPSFLPVVYESTLEDDWTSPETWAKSNPNYGISVNERYMKKKCQQALDEPSFENTFKRLHLNIVTEAATRWLSMAKWDACGGQEINTKHLVNERCFGGLDLASTVDLAAFSLFFPDSNITLQHYWIPELNAHQREKRDKVPYTTWAKQGFLTMTPGNVIDYRYIRQEINDLCSIYDVQEIAYDPFNARQLCIQMAEEDGLEMLEHRQGFISMNAPTKELERMVISGNLNHGDNPVLRWMAGNVMVSEDPAGNIKPDKKKSSEKIDGVVAMIMAISCALANAVDRRTKSVYEERGMIVL